MSPRLAAAYTSLHVSASELSACRGGAKAATQLRGALLARTTLKLRLLAVTIQRQVATVRLTRHQQETSAGKRGEFDSMSVARLSSVDFCRQAAGARTIPVTTL